MLPSRSLIWSIMCCHNLFHKAAGVLTQGLKYIGRDLGSGSVMEKKKWWYRKEAIFFSQLIRLKGRMTAMSIYQLWLHLMDWLLLKWCWKCFFLTKYILLFPKSPYSFALLRDKVQRADKRDMTFPLLIVNF